MSCDRVRRTDPVLRSPGFLVVAVAASLLGLLSQPQGGTQSTTSKIKFCFRYEADFADSGSGEDYWRERVASREARGMKVRIIRNSRSAALFDGFLDDGFGGNGSGCTPALAVASGSATYAFHLTSRGRIQGNELVVKDYDAAQQSPVTWIASGGKLGPGTWVIDLGPPPSTARNVFNVYQANAFALYRHTGALAKTG
ncbi:MAG: hypothetical protein ACREQ9_14510, partial [Candidatus Binatia bacterium]